MIFPSARQGWSDALAAYSLAAPVLQLVSTALTGGLLPLSLNHIWTGLSVCLLEAAALIASPGPRHGRRLVHGGHWTVLLVAAAAPACLVMLFCGQGSLAARGSWWCSSSPSTGWAGNCG
jgi:hypothetical protein